MTPQAEFQAAVLDQLRHAPLDPPAQAALLQALSSVTPREGAVTANADGPLAEWLGEPPANPAQLSSKHFDAALPSATSSFPAASVQPR
jgi:hypothetical protein